MNTAKEILVDNNSELTSQHIAKISYLEEWIINAMEEYARKSSKNKSLRFAEWLSVNGTLNNDNYWILKGHYPETFSTEQMYYKWEHDSGMKFKNS